MNTNQKIAGKFLTSRIRQLLVAVLSVTFGISMYVFMNSFMEGVNSEQTEITFTSMAHIKIYNELESEVAPILPADDDSGSVLMVSNLKSINYTEGIRNADEIKEELANSSKITGVTAQLNQNVFIRNGVARASAALSGVETLTEDLLFKTSQYLIEGNLYELDKQANGIILGSGLAKKIGVNTGNHVTLITSDGTNKSFRVLGLIETGANGPDRSRAIVTLQAAQQLFSKNRSYATEVLVNIEDYTQAESVATQISQMTDYKVEPWQEGNGQLDSANILRDIIAIAVSLTILIVAGFGIYNIMTMTVNEKMKEIAILKAMGFSGGDVIEIFLTQSVVIGLLGGVSGVVLGNVIVQIIDQIPFNVGTLTTLPVAYRPIDYLLAFSFGLLITFLAGYLPAKKASKIDPVAILRG